MIGVLLTNTFKLQDNRRIYTIILDDKNRKIIKEFY